MALKDDVRDLAEIPTLRELEPDALRLIAFAAEILIIPRGQTLFRAGDASDGGLVVLGGSIALTTPGSPSVVVRPPSLIGDMALLIDTIRPCTALAIETVRLMKISRTLFNRVLSEHPGSAVRLHGKNRKQLQALSLHLNELASTLDQLTD